MELDFHLYQLHRNFEDYVELCHTIVFLEVLKILFVGPFGLLAVPLTPWGLVKISVLFRRRGWILLQQELENYGGNWKLFCVMYIVFL